MANENIATPKPVKVSSAARQARSSARKQRCNQAMRNRIRTGLRLLADLLGKKSPDANGQGRQVISWIDRAAKTHVIHRNAAGRFKAQVMTRLQQLPKK